MIPPWDDSPFQQIQFFLASFFGQKKWDPFKVHKKTLGPGFPEKKTDQRFPGWFISDENLTKSYIRLFLDYEMAAKIWGEFLQEMCSLGWDLCSHLLTSYGLDSLTLIHPSSFCSSCLKASFEILTYYSNSIYSTPKTLTKRTVGAARSTFWGNDMARCRDLRLTGTEPVVFVGTVWSLVFLRKVQGGLAPLF